MLTPSRLHELRGLLVGVRWEDFLEDRTVTRDGVTFCGRYGLFLNEPVIAILHGKEFIAIRKLSSTQSYKFHKEKSDRERYTLPDGGEPFRSALEWIKANNPNPPLDLVITPEPDPQPLPLALNEVLA